MPVMLAVGLHEINITAKESENNRRLKIFLKPDCKMMKA